MDPLLYSKCMRMTNDRKGDCELVNQKQRVFWRMDTNWLIDDT
jgi:hypothetical protein